MTNEISSNTYLGMLVRLHVWFLAAGCVINIHIGYQRTIIHSPPIKRSINKHCIYLCKWIFIISFTIKLRSSFHFGWRQFYRYGVITYIMHFAQFKKSMNDKYLILLQTLHILLLMYAKKTKNKYSIQKQTITTELPAIGSIIHMIR